MKRLAEYVAGVVSASVVGIVNGAVAAGLTGVPLDAGVRVGALSHALSAVVALAVIVGVAVLLDVDGPSGRGS